MLKLQNRKSTFFKDLNGDFKIFLELAVGLPVAFGIGFLGFLPIVTAVTLIVADVVLIFGGPIAACVSLVVLGPTFRALFCLAGLPLGALLIVPILALRRFSMVVWRKYLNYFWPVKWENSIYKERVLRNFFD